ncbi:hypothetical protein KFL_002640230 [Klebsormidium nitens]|uniref:Uncharacterized protein n=1 Tax=Klebsormidium nitens TaxID=105231 RepID=A0A0U9HK89_KLENI|nr:hypothetical protein KFL_002640230 [Klebsormidium nitens]|eukprot:GAQ86002.1 hypothetical protein KFL_002640230 [Klebsormidium nitens]
MGTDDQQREGAAAQAIPLSADLLTAARCQVAMLSAVDNAPELHTPAGAQQAARRYRHCWLPLLAKQGPGAQLLPPLDVHWAWHCHMLNPVMYAQDCGRLLGRTLDHPLISDDTLAFGTAMSLWASECPNEPWDPVPGSAEPAEVGSIELKLVAAMGRQTSFFYQVNRPGFLDLRYLEGSLARYRMFLHLMRRTRGSGLFCVPTYDVDLMWHAHQLCPLAYAEDCQNVMGKLIDHDDTDQDRSTGAKLDTSFQSTADTWLALYGVPYERAGTLYLGEAPPPLPVPAPFPIPPLAKAAHASHHNGALQAALTNRSVCQVCVVVTEAKNLERHKGVIHVKARPLAKLSKPCMQTSGALAGAASGWPREAASFQVEMSTGGLVFEVWDRPAGILSGLKSDKLLAAAQVTWPEVLEQPGYVLERMLLLSPTGKFKHGEKPPSLRVALSITPPEQGPYLLRTWPRATLTDDNGEPVGAESTGRWVTRAVKDHTGADVAVMRTLAKTGRKDRKTQESPVAVSPGQRLHQLHNLAASNTPGVVVGKAQELLPPGTLYGTPYGEAASYVADISLTDDSSVTYELTVRLKASGERALTAALTPKVATWARKQPLQSPPVALIEGRQLEYAVPGASPAQEAGFFTLVRYTAEHPRGKATALLNWTRGIMEVQPTERIPLVALLGTCLAQAAQDLTPPAAPDRRTKLRVLKAQRAAEKAAKKRGGRPVDEWGSVAYSRPHGGTTTRQTSSSSSGGTDNSLPLWYMTPLLIDTSSGGGCGSVEHHHNHGAGACSTAAGLCGSAGAGCAASACGASGSCGASAGTWRGGQFVWGGKQLRRRGEQLWGRGEQLWRRGEQLWRGGKQLLGRE